MSALHTTVLVVDDEEIVGHFMSRVLETEGYRVLVAANADDALALVANLRIDLVLTDIRMPGKSGIALGRELAQFANAPKVMYVSASDTPPEDVNSAHYLQKPFSAADLKAKVRAVLKR
jgi:DNA-binding response OmpR family regulator